MKAKFIYEAIKHLAPRDESEMRAMFDKLSPLQKLESYKEMGIDLSILEFKQILDKLTPAGLAGFAIKYNQPKLYIEAIKRGHKMTASNKANIIKNQRYFESNWEGKKDWLEVINKFVNKGRKKIVDRDPKENLKDYKIARKKINDLHAKGSDGYSMKDVTSPRQETNGTMAFRLKVLKTYYNGRVPQYEPNEFSISKNGYVRKYYPSMFSKVANNLIENPYLTYEELADILIKYLKNHNFVNES